MMMTIITFMMIGLTMTAGAVSCDNDDDNDVYADDGIVR